MQEKEQNKCRIDYEADKIWCRTIRSLAYIFRSFPVGASKLYLANGLVNYGDISSEWHEGSPDWAFGPPAK